MVARACGGVKTYGELGGDLPHVVEFDQEVALPESAVVFAVGDQPEADILLHSHHAADRFLLDAREFGRRDFGLLGGETRGDKRIRPDKAADMLGTKRRFGWRKHGSGASSSPFQR